MPLALPYRDESIAREKESSHQDLEQLKSSFLDIQAALMMEKSVVIGELESKNKDVEELAATLKSAETSWSMEKAAMINDLEGKNKELMDVNDELKAVQAVVTEKNNVMADLHVEIMMKVVTLTPTPCLSYSLRPLRTSSQSNSYLTIMEWGNYPYLTLPYKYRPMS